MGVDAVTRDIVEDTNSAGSTISMRPHADRLIGEIVKRMRADRIKVL
jgi:hypothetical protein